MNGVLHGRVHEAWGGDTYPMVSNSLKDASGNLRASSGIAKHDSQVKPCRTRSGLLLHQHAPDGLSMGLLSDRAFRTLLMISMALS